MHTKSHVLIFLEAMMNCTLRHILTMLILLLMVTAMPAFARTVGTVTHLSGPLFAKNEAGAKRALSLKSAVEEGDTLVSEKRTYGRVKFIDGGEITLRPDSMLVVESYIFNKEKPTEDRAALNLLKGGLRAVTGQVGKRGNVDAYRMKTPAATIGVRGTTYDMKVCQDGSCAGLADGIYLYVRDGSIAVTTNAGSGVFGAGTYAYVKDVGSMPVVLPRDPGLNLNIPVLDKKSCGIR